MTVKEIREQSGMSRAEFSRKYDIPVRTLEDWEHEKRKCSPYLEKLLERIVNEDCKAEAIYRNNNLMKELGSIYADLIEILNKRNGWSHNPYPNADIFPIKYFTMIFMTAAKLGIPDDLNNRIADFMGFIDFDDWTSSMNTPCPLESRMFFDVGMMDKRIS